MTGTQGLSGMDAKADGFCPQCGALEDEACQRPDGSPIPDHKARHPYRALHPTDGAGCQGCACEAEHDGDYGSSGHAGPCPRHTCDPTDGAS